MIRNATKNTVLAQRCRIRRSLFSRCIGLMFAKHMTPTVLAFPYETTADIHTCFVRHYLDVVFLNDHWQVVELVQGLRPWRFYAPKKRAMFVIELPEGTITQSKTKVGDVVNFL